MICPTKRAAYPSAGLGFYSLGSLENDIALASSGSVVGSALSLTASGLNATLTVPDISALPNYQGSLELQYQGFGAAEKLKDADGNALLVLISPTHGGNLVDLP